MITLLCCFAILLNRSGAFLVPKRALASVPLSARRMLGSSASTGPCQLDNPTLLARSAGETGDKLFAVYNPARPGEVIGHAPAMTLLDARAAIQTAHGALDSWRDRTTATHRSRLLQAWSRLIQDNKNDIAKIMTLESGKPLAESLGEVRYSLEFLDFFAGEALRPTSAGGGFLVPTPFTNPSDNISPRGTIMVMHEAVGVAALIAPWNFPAAMIARKVAAALAAGCPCVVKPAHQTPLTALAMQKLAYDAGIPREVLQMVTCDGDLTKDIGYEFTTNELVRKVSFTGSTAVGKVLLKQCADTVKRVSMELGGNAPFVVFEDADLEVAVQAAVKSKFRNAGQTCVCADRFLVHTSIHDEFVKRVVKKIQETLVVGEGMNETTTMGPLITKQAVEKVHRKVESAIQQGATCLLGGNKMPLSGPNFYEATVLANVSPESDIFKDETFGPVMAILKFETDVEALRIANHCSVGLAGYFCTKDLSRAFQFARALRCGLIGVNEGIISTAVAPFGGVKESGMGREGSSLGIAEYLETKYVFINA